MEGKLKLFISYSHKDENYINEFIKHLVPLKDNSFVDEWYDRKIEAGKNFQNEIDKHLDEADIICLFISGNFLASPACKKEMEKSLELMRKKNVRVISIILTPCGWKEYPELKDELLAIPTDGKPISDFEDINKGWQDVMKWLKKVIETERYQKNLEISTHFQKEIENAYLLTKSHPRKSQITLSDIFVYPEISIFNDLREFQKDENASIIIDKFHEFEKILIAGEDQSGKTALCYKIYKELKAKGFIPVYISDKQNMLLGNIDNKIEKELAQQYENIDISKINKEKIVPIIDDFHYAKHKEKHLGHLQKYKYQILVVDDIFGLNIKQEALISSYTHIKINQLPPSLRNELIKKWIDITDKEEIVRDNDYYRELDNKTEIVERVLGRIIGNGIVPAYPFFVLSIVSTYDTFEKPLDQEITSQGYYYQALIYFFLRKQGVKNEHIDTYINFLTELSIELFRLKKNSLSEHEFEIFLKKYLSEFNFPVNKDVLLKNLVNTQIIHIDSFNNYSFSYKYLYYFFVAKYLAENFNNEEKTIETIINNLHVNENAYIAIFISHHSNNEKVLDEIVLNSLYLFDKYKPATLSKNETDFFDDKLDEIIQAVLPRATSTPEKERKNRLKQKDELEKLKKEESDAFEEFENDEDELAIELRRAIKTVEVMGRIIKNRSGSMRKKRLEEIFEEGMNVHLRILSSFIDVIKKDDATQEIISFIERRLSKIIEEKEAENNKKPTDERLKKIAETIFWNLSFQIVYSIINKIINSLGSDNLIQIVGNVCDRISTPASFLVKHGILMWYSKNLQIDNIVKYIEEDGFSKTAESILKYMVANHCALHKIYYKDLEKVVKKLKIPAKRIYMLRAKKK